MVIRERNRFGRSSSTDTPDDLVVTVPTAATFTAFTALSNGAAVAAYTVIQGTDSLITVLTQNILNRVLMAALARVAAASNGQLAVEAAKAAEPPFDAILMDLQMPVMDGFKATHVLRAAPVSGSPRFQCNNWRYANPALARGWSG